MYFSCVLKVIAYLQLIVQCAMSALELSESFQSSHLVHSCPTVLKVFVVDVQAMDYNGSVNHI